MRFTKLLAMLFMAAALPVRATDDEPSAAPSSTEPTLGESSAAVDASPTADTATTSSSTTIEQASDTASAESAVRSPSLSGEAGNAVAAADAGAPVAGDAPAAGGDAGNGVADQTQPASSATGLDSSATPTGQVDSSASSDAGAPAGDVPNAIASTAATPSESAAESSAPPASPGAGTVEDQASGTTGSDPTHPALAHLVSLESMFDRMLLRGEQFAMDEWKALTGAIRALL